MQLTRLFLALLLLASANSAVARDTAVDLDESLPLQSLQYYSTIEFSAAEVEKMMVDLRHCTSDQECLQELKQAATLHKLKPFSKNIRTMEGSTHVLLLPLVYIAFLEASGYFVGRLTTVSSINPGEIVAAIILFGLAIVFNGNSQFGWHRALTNEAFQVNSLEKMIKRVNKVMHDDQPLMVISQKVSADGIIYQIKLHPLIQENIQTINNIELMKAMEKAQSFLQTYNTQEVQNS